MSKVKTPSAITTSKIKSYLKAVVPDQVFQASALKVLKDKVEEILEDLGQRSQQISRAEEGKHVLARHVEQAIQEILAPTPDVARIIEFLFALPTAEIQNVADAAERYARDLEKGEKPGKARARVEAGQTELRLDIAREFAQALEDLKKDEAGEQIALARLKGKGRKRIKVV